MRPATTVVPHEAALLTIVGVWLAAGAVGATTEPQPGHPASERRALRRKSQLQKFGRPCRNATDCRSGICGSSCSATDSSCLCPAEVSTECGRSAAGYPEGNCSSVCCATVAPSDAQRGGEVCVADLAKTSAARSARAWDKAEAHRRQETFVDVEVNALAVGNGSRGFGESCSTWSQCASGVCSTSCLCNEAWLATPQPCQCATGTTAKTLTCGDFFVGKSGCASHCSPCTPEECSKLPTDCRWGCTAGLGGGTCSPYPQFFLGTDRCSRCCNANFCKASGRGLRGDWIVNISGLAPGMDNVGKDLWTAAEVACPLGQSWMGSACRHTCAQIPGTAVERILDLGNNSWTLDPSQDMLFTEGAIVATVCAQGYVALRKAWTLRCDGRNWSAEDIVQEANVTYESGNLAQYKVRDEEECLKRLRQHPEAKAYTMFPAVDWEYNCFLRPGLSNRTKMDEAYSGRRATHEGLPDCTEVHCEVPAEPVGAWVLVGDLANQSLQLECSDGYIPRGGPVVIECAAAATRPPSTSAPKPPPAYCAPGGGGDAEAWRSYLRGSAMSSLMMVSVVLLTIWFACWRDPPKREEGGTRRGASRRAGGERRGGPLLE